MNPSANGAKIQDPEKFAALSPIASPDESRVLTETETKGSKKDKMQRLQHFFFALLVVAVLSVSFVCSSPDNIRRHNAVPTPPYPQAQPPAIEDPSAKEFQDLLNSIEPASLHEVLHTHLKEKYQHGVYQEDKTAMEMMHQQDAETARSLIELAKRQGAGSTNGTVATVTPTSTSVVTTTQGTTSTVQPSSTSTVVASGTTSSTPQATESSTSAKSSPASSSSPSSQGASTSTAPTQVVPSTSSVVSASTTTAGPKTTTKANSASSSQTSQGASSSAPSSSTSSAASSTEDSQTPSESVTQTLVYKTTLANGAQSTVTSITVVPGQAGARSGSGSKTSNANASLQTNAGNQKSFGMNVVVGALGFAAVVAL